MTYDPLTYWRARGQTFAEQELAIVDLLSSLEFESVLDVGCGPGRLASLIRGIRPTATYTGIDVSRHVLRLAEVRWPGGEFVQTTLAGFRPRGRKWDLVIASEVLMHVPPADLARSVALLRSMSSRHVVTLDWTAPGHGASHNFRHDYRAAFASAGLRLLSSRPLGRQTLHGLAA